MTRKSKDQKRPKSTFQQKAFLQLCRSHGLPDPVAEYRFHAKRRWRIDYYFETNETRLALEVEGGVYTYGRHNRASGFVADMEKYNALAQAGIFLIRVMPKDLLKKSTCDLIKSVLDRDC